MVILFFKFFLPIISVPYDVIYFLFPLVIKEVATDRRSDPIHLGLQEPTFSGTMDNGEDDVVYHPPGYLGPYLGHSGREKKDQETFEVVRRGDGNADISGYFVRATRRTDPSDYLVRSIRQPSIVLGSKKLTPTQREYITTHLSSRK